MNQYSSATGSTSELRVVCGTFQMDLLGRRELLHSWETDSVLAGLGVRPVKIISVHPHRDRGTEKLREITHMHTHTHTSSCIIRSACTGCASECTVCFLRPVHAQGLLRIWNVFLTKHNPMPLSSFSSNGVFSIKTFLGGGAGTGDICNSVNNKNKGKI